MGWLRIIIAIIVVAACLLDSSSRQIQLHARLCSMKYLSAHLSLYLAAVCPPESRLASQPAERAWQASSQQAACCAAMVIISFGAFSVSTAAANPIGTSPNVDVRRPARPLESSTLLADEQPPARGRIGLTCKCRLWAGCLGRKARQKARLAALERAVEAASRVQRRLCVRFGLLAKLLPSSRQALAGSCWPPLNSLGGARRSIASWIETF